MILVILLNFDYQSYGIHVKEAVFITKIRLEIDIFDAKTSKTSKSFESLSFGKLVPSSSVSSKLFWFKLPVISIISSHPTVGFLGRIPT